MNNIDIEVKREMFRFRYRGNWHREEVHYIGNRDEAFKQWSEGIKKPYIEKEKEEQIKELEKFYKRPKYSKHIEPSIWEQLGPLWAFLYVNALLFLFVYIITRH